MKSAESSGIDSDHRERLRRAPRRSIGSTDIMRRPSSCSVATIVPISAAVAEPARPVASSAVSTGPSSRIRRQADDRAERLGGAEAHERVVALQARAPCRPRGRRRR